MQKIKSISRITGHSYRPDVLIRGRGVSYASRGLWYRQTGDDNNNVPVTVKFRPTGWNKLYEFEAVFGGNQSQDLDCVITNTSGHQDRSDVFTVNLNRLNNDGAIISSRRIYQANAHIEKTICPSCRGDIAYISKDRLWKCGDSLCGFSYTPETCKDMHDNWRDSDFGMSTVKMAHNDRREIHIDRTSLNKCSTPNGNDLIQKIYNE